MTGTYDFFAARSAIISLGVINDSQKDFYNYNKRKCETLSTISDIV